MTAVDDEFGEEVGTGVEVVVVVNVGAAVVEVETIVDVVIAVVEELPRVSVVDVVVGDGVTI
jgi:hypothetical protein